MIRRNLSVLYDLIVNTFKWNALECGYFATSSTPITRRNRDTLQKPEPFKTILSQNTNLYGFSFEAKLQQSITAYSKSKYKDRIILNDSDDVIIMGPSTSTLARRKPVMGIYFGRLLKKSKSNIDILIVTRNGFIIVDVKAYKRGFENDLNDKNRLALLHKSVATMQTQQKVLSSLGQGKSYILLVNRDTIDAKPFPSTLLQHLITQQNLFNILEGIMKEGTDTNNTQKDENDSFEETIINILPKMKQYDTLKVRDLPLLYGEVDKIKIQYFSDYYPSVLKNSSTKSMIKLQDLLNWQWNNTESDSYLNSVQRVYIRPDSFGGQNIHSICQLGYSSNNFKFKNTKKKLRHSTLFNYIYEHLLQYDPALLFQVTTIYTSDRKQQQQHLIPIPAGQRACLSFKLGAYGNSTSCQFPLDSLLYLKIGSNHAHESKY